LVGRAIKGRRDEWVVATKFGHRFKERFERDDVYEPALVREQLEASLRALQTDYVDLYQFHSGTDEMFQTPGLWEMLRGFVESGVVRYLGISISSSYKGTLQVDTALDVGVGAIQVVYNRLQRDAEQQYFEVSQRADLGVLARVPLASGFLSGKYGPEARFAETDVRTVWHSEAKRREWAARVADLRREVPDGVPMAPWALAWCLQHPAVSCVIPGCKTVEQVESNGRAAELPVVSEGHPQAWT
jgi:aryl-alcohol dehydrogenase-like predicted oxidoreductase